MERELPFRGVIVLVFIMKFFCPHMGHSQEIRIVNAQSSITAVMGQDLTIPCFVTRNDNQELDLDLSAVNVGWTKRSSSGDVYDVYKYLGYGDEQIRPGSLIEENALKRGNASLALHLVQRSDEGKYTCTVFITPQKATAEVDVHLLAQPDVTLSPTEPIVEPGREKSLTCKVTRFYPGTLKIRWVKYGAASGTRSSLDKATCLSVPEENSDGTFNASSLLTVRPSSLEEDGDLYSCTVTHLSFNQDQTINITLTVKEPPTSSICPATIILFFLTLIGALLIGSLALCLMKLSPKISDIAGIEDLVHGKSSNLSWMVSGFKPRDIEICTYLERGGQRQEIGSWKYPLPDNQNYKDVLYAERGEGFGLLKQTNVIKCLTPNFLGFSNNCHCSTSITPDKRKDKGAELVIEVKHAALKTTLIKRQKLNIKGGMIGTKS